MAFQNLNDAYPWLAGTLILCLAVLVGYIVNLGITTVAARLARRTSTPIDDALIANIRRPVGLFLPASAALLTLPFITLPEAVLPAVRQGLNILLIATVGWGTLGLLRAIGDIVLARFKIDHTDNLAAREVRTRVLVFNRIAVVVVIILTGALILMTFPNIRHLGISLFASAGVARIVIGADGMHSTVAKAVGAEEYNTKPSLSFAYYAYWSGFPPGTCEIHFGPENGVLSFPTNDGLQCVAVGGPDEEFHEFRKDIESNFKKVIDGNPSLAEKMKDAKREERFVGTNDQPNFFRKPYGNGWALVGDAGYHRDFATGLGIMDAFRDSQLLADAIDEGFSGRGLLEEAMAGYQRTRDEIAEPLYELTTQLVSGDAPKPEQFLAYGLAMEKMMPAITEGAQA